MFIEGLAHHIEHFCVIDKRQRPHWHSMSQPTELAAWGRKSFNLHNQEKWHCLKKGSSKNSVELANNTKDSGFLFYW